MTYPPIKVSLRPAERRVCEPPSAADPYEWAERYRILFAGERKGRRWETAYTPYTKFPMQVMAWPSVRRVNLCWSPQSAKTQVGLNFLGWVADCHPAECMWVMPDEEASKKAYEKRLLPLFTKTDRLRSLLTGRVRDLSYSGIRLSNGFDLVLPSAKSVTSIASDSIRFIIMDETDKYGDFAGKEASPISLIEERARSYSNTCVIIKMCTVTTKDGVIWVALELESDVVFDYFARCPHPLCGSYQLMKPEQISCRGIDDPRELMRTRAARYVCEDCGAEWDDRLRNHAIAGGEWRPRVQVDAPTSVGFHLPAWNSPFVSLSECAAARLNGQKSVVKKQHYVTQICSLPWENVVRNPDEDKLRELVDKDLPARTVPEGSMALTLAVDMQLRYFVYSVLAHAVRPVRRSWLIDYGEVLTWEELDTILFTTWPLAKGGRMGIWRAGIDTGGGVDDDPNAESIKKLTRTEEAYLWLQEKKRLGFVFGLKGSPRPMIKRISRSEIDVLPRSRRKLAHMIELHNLDTGYFKDIVDERLNDPETGRPIHFHAETGEDFLRQLTSEKKVRDAKGREKWEKKGSRPNHYWDTLVYHEGLCSVLWKPCLDLLPRPQRVGNQDGAVWAMPSATPGGGTSVHDIRAGLTGRDGWSSGR
jgi:phage terminase large subunit GpA-like protein